MSGYEYIVGRGGDEWESRAAEQKLGSAYTIAQGHKSMALY